MGTIQESTTLIPARLDRLNVTRYHHLIFWLTSLGIYFGTTDLFLILSSAQVIAQTFTLNTVQMGFLIGVSAIGGIFGAVIAGLVGDYAGRKKVFMWTLALYGVGSIITGLAPNFNTFVLGRLIVGAGVGGELPTVLAMIGEFMPVRRRGNFLVLVQAMFSIGVPSASYLVLLILPSMGWRPLFFILAVPAFVLLGLRQTLPESPRWLECKGRQKEAEAIVSRLEKMVEAKQGKPLPPIDPSLAVPLKEVKAPMREIFTSKFRKRTAFLSVTWLVTSLLPVGLTGFWVTILIVHGGYSLITALTFMSIGSFGAIPGFLSTMYLVEKVGRKLVMASSYILLGLFTVLMALVMSNLTLLLVTGFFWFALLSVNFGSILPYTSELYPTRERSSGAGWGALMYNIGTFGGPVIIGAVFASVTTLQLLLAFGLVLVATTVAPFWLGLETKGKRLEEISE